MPCQYVIWDFNKSFRLRRVDIGVGTNFALPTVPKSWNWSRNSEPENRKSLGQLLPPAAEPNIFFSQQFTLKKLFTVEDFDQYVYLARALSGNEIRIPQFSLRKSTYSYDSCSFSSFTFHICLYSSSRYSFITPESSGISSFITCPFIDSLYDK
ncbi:hypothetical protein CHS0354_036797 [Potamilus streckersoni]|uniref:Uncharacterized protein n=1 Tax=Potamilus streckersoni TaxID=2493646 RepID=A0AAE0SKA3_9BIVA|nr:hypothetical protein CHS0354_036797 [Potamilus streckersoni]